MSRAVAAVVILVAAGWAMAGPCAAQDAAGPVVRRLTTDGAFKQRPAFSRDGRFVSYGQHREDSIAVHVLEVGTGTTRRIGERKEPDYDATWSADGKRLVFVRVTQSGTQGNLEIYTMGPEGEDPTLVQGDEGKLSHEEWPSYGPDGAWVLMTSTREGNPELYRVRADGKERVRLTNDPALDAHPAWSGDGKRVAFATDRYGDWELAVVSAEGGAVERLTEAEGTDDYPAWSPDGKRIAWTSYRTGNAEVWVMEVATKQARNVTQSEAWESFPAWSPDGRRLVFCSDRGGEVDLYEVEAGDGGSASAGR